MDDPVDPQSDMFIDVIIAGATTPTSHRAAWYFATVPHSARGGPKARRLAWRGTWLAKSVPLLRIKRHPANRTRGTMQRIRCNRHGSRRTCELNPHVAVGCLPDHRQMMSCYCNAALRRRRRWELLPPPPNRTLNEIGPTRLFSKCAGPFLFGWNIPVAAGILACSGVVGVMSACSRLQNSRTF